MNNYSEYDLLFKVLLLGNSGVGKSCIILRYTENQFNPNLMNSIGVDFKIKNITHKDKLVKLQIWDTAGQERFRTITTSYYKGAQAIVIVFDLTDRDSFDNIKSWVNDIKQFAKPDIMKILIGNKCDLKTRRLITKEEGEEAAKLNGCIKYIETSAKETININDIFNNLTEQYLEKHTITNNLRSSKQNLKNNKYSITSNNQNMLYIESKRKKGCCK